MEANPHSMNEKEIGRIATRKPRIWLLLHIRSGPLFLPTMAGAVF
jgi:hypothetical protein